MNKKKKSRAVVVTVIMVILALLLLNPGFLPVSQSTRESMDELRKTYFLLGKSGHITAAHILTVVLEICLLWILYRIIRLVLMTVGRKDTRAQTVTNMIVGAVRYLMVVLGLIWGLSTLGVNAVAVLAGVGLIGLILGFGAQSLIEDIITGIFIIFESKYVIGDIIILDDFRGTVRDIGVRTTTIEDAGGNLKVVNNSDIRNFQNRSRNASKAACEVSVSYDTDLRALEKLLEESLPPMYEAHRDLYLGAPKYLGVTELADSGVNLKFIVETKEENIFSAQRQLTRDIRVLFADKGVEIPFPQVVVHQAGN